MYGLLGNSVFGGASQFSAMKLNLLKGYAKLWHLMAPILVEYLAEYITHVVEAFRTTAILGYREMTS